MGTPYEKTLDLGALSADDIVKIAFPSRVKLRAINCTGPAAFNLDVYSRAFTWAAAKDLAYIEDDGNGNTRLIFEDERHELQVGDTVAVAGTTEAGYNTDHVVTGITDDYCVVTDQTFTAAATGGTANLAIPAAEQPLYEVIDQQAAASGVVRWAGDVPFFNHDAPIHLGNPRWIYVKVSADGSYRITLRAVSDTDLL